jgi:hypothetical protein
MPHKDDQKETDGLGDTAPFQSIEGGGSSDTPGSADGDADEASESDDGTRDPDEAVDQDSKASFPASDPPAW